MPSKTLEEFECPGAQKAGTAWSQPNQSSYDFRSDTVTTATPTMLEAVISANFNDGWTSGGDTKILEDFVSELVGKPVTQFMVSSTMANQVAIWAHLGTPPAGVLCDIRSHILHMEAGSLSMLSGALPQPVTPSNGLYITLEDVKRKVVLMDESKPASACDCPTRIIHIENPLGGNIMPLTEMRRIKTFAEAHGIKVNLDGARLWDATAAGAGDLADLSASADSVNLSLSKGIGASVGSTLSGDADFMVRAKSIHKSMGGAMRQPGILARAAHTAIHETFGHDGSGETADALRRAHSVAQRLAERWKKLGGILLVPQETSMVWLDLEAAGIKESQWVQEANKGFGILLHSCRIVTHYQISDEAMEKLEEYMQYAMDHLSNSQDCVFPQNEAVSRLAACMQDVYRHKRNHDG